MSFKFRTLSVLPFLLISLALVFALPARAAYDEALIELGKTKFGENCSGFCHGAGGKGAQAPCLICGSFKRGESDEAIARNTAQARFAIKNC